MPEVAEYKTGRIVKGVGGLYTARDNDGAEYILRARGRFRLDGVSPLVGDRVVFLPAANEAHALLLEILPRSSECVRPPAANIDLLVIVVAAIPEPDFLLVDRLLVHARRSGFSALLCVNKSDLNHTLFRELSDQYRQTGVPVLSVSARAGEGLSFLQTEMAGKLCCMAGQSAVGKSTLLNAMMGLSQKTGELSVKISRGRHTTRHTELLEANGFSVLDTPGFSLMDLSPGMAPEKLLDYYPEYAAYQPECRFSPCLHDREPDCAIWRAVNDGTLNKVRHERYRLLLEEVRKTWKSRYH